MEIDYDMRKLFNEEYLTQVAYMYNNMPRGLLGPHTTEYGLRIAIYLPHCNSVEFVNKDNGEVHRAYPIHEKGIFAANIHTDRVFSYFYRAWDEEGNCYEGEDSNAYPTQFSEMDGYLFGQGTHYDLYEKLGAHKKTINGVNGVLFNVWAPNAQRVSVIGNFNGWNPAIHMMSKVSEVGVHEIFIPDIGENEMYKFQVKTVDGFCVDKTDPFGFTQQMRPETASIVSDLSAYQWQDEKWMTDRKTYDFNTSPMSIYEVHLGSWRQNEDGSFLSYRELAEKLGAYVVDMGYTHIELMGILEHPFDGSWGYQVTGYFAPTSRFGAPEDFMYFVDHMHSLGIGVFLDWVPAHFPKDSHGLGRFDGTCLYEHPDPRRGEHPDWGTFIFNYERNEVRNFLIASGLFWLNKFHLDGLRVDAVASMLYLDYGKSDGQWLPNIYGGRENLDAVEFFKHLNSMVEQYAPGTLVIAEESTAWAGVTRSVHQDGLGFGLKWNMGWMNDFLEYISKDPVYRQYEHGKLTFSMIYAYTEKFIQVLSHDEVVYGKCSMINKMPGDDWQKFANLRVAYGFMFAHPGKKLLFMGQEFAQYDEWNSQVGLQWFLIDDNKNNADMQRYYRALQHFYKDNKAFYEQDFDPEGFEWMSCDDYQSSVVSLVRKTKNGKKSILCICNFTPVVRENYRVGVPNLGNYKAVFNSDDPEFGGTGDYPQTDKKAERVDWNYKKQSIEVTIPPLAMIAFEYNHTMPKPESAPKKKTAKKTEVVKPAGKKIAKAAKKVKAPEKKEAPAKKAAPAKSAKAPKKTAKAPKKAE
ncbi:MAG: 1,4-alpha-glucan branching protein GlgB [Ruminococcus sp.]|nr:1,4-alpha-glucan branching protein GlgB [Ruminococcus sp.]